MSTSGKEAVARRPSSPVRSKMHGRYRVLRAATPRGAPRSVDRDWAGRNAEVRVKGLSPENQIVSVVAEPVFGWRRQHPPARVGTTGVRDHGMSSRPASERERSAESRVEEQRPWPRDVRQGVNAESASILSAEVRYLHSSGETGQLPWSEGRYGEVNLQRPPARTSAVGSMFAYGDQGGIREAVTRRAFRVFDGFRTPVVGSHQHCAEGRSPRKHQPKSRVRENRTHGSVRGGGR